MYISLIPVQNEFIWIFYTLDQRFSKHPCAEYLHDDRCGIHSPPNGCNYDLWLLSSNEHSSIEEDWWIFKVIIIFIIKQMHHLKLKLKKSDKYLVALFYTLILVYCYLVRFLKLANEGFTTDNSFLRCNWSTLRDHLNMTLSLSCSVSLESRRLTWNGLRRKWLSRQIRQFCFFQSVTEIRSKSWLFGCFFRLRLILLFILLRLHACAAEV